MDNLNVVNRVDKVQVNLKNVSEECVGVLSFIPLRLFPIEYIYAFFYNKMEEKFTSSAEHAMDLNVLENIHDAYCVLVEKNLEIWRKFPLFEFEKKYI